MADSLEIHRLMYSDESDDGEVEELLDHDLEDLLNEDEELSRVESDPELRSRQLAYPPLPYYSSPTAHHDVKDSLGLLTPMQELTESEAGSFTSRHSVFRDGVESRVRKVSFSPAPDEDPVEVLERSRSPGEDSAVLKARQERVRTWQEKHQFASDEMPDFIMSEIDSTTLMKSMETMPPSFLPSMVETMTNSLTTIRSQLSTLQAVALLGDRLHHLQPYPPNIDLSPLIKKLCTMVGESRTPESSLTLARLIHGAGPSLITDHLLAIINSASGSKRKPAAIDGLTYALLLFPRDDFEIEKVAESVCMCLWSPKRRVRQAALECLAVIAHVLGPGIAMPFLRELIEEKRPRPHVSHGNPSSAVSTRVSRRMLPSPSPGGLVEYALVLPSRAALNRLQLEEPEPGRAELDPILGKSEFGADVVWIIHGTSAPTSGGQWSSNEVSPRASSNSSSRSSRKSGTRKTDSLHAKHREVEKQKSNENIILNAYNLEDLGEEEPVLPITPDSVDTPPDLEEDFSHLKGTPRDRDSGVSSLKSIRVVSPTENEIADAEDESFETECTAQIVADLGTETETQASREMTASPPIPTHQEPPEYILRRPILPRSTMAKTASKSSRDPPSVPSTSSSSSGRKSGSRTSTTTPKRGIRVKPRGYMGLTPASNSGGVFPAELPALEQPAPALNMGLSKLGSIDWETNIEGFQLLIRLLRHHPDVLRADLHNVNMAALKHLSNLRSQVSRAACLFFKEMFCTMGRNMEPDVEKIAEKLLDKSVDTNKFIRESSVGALEAMTMNLHPAKTIVPLEHFGSKHKHGSVRMTTARMTTVLVKHMGAEKSLTQMPDKLLPMLVQFLQEGSQETRSHAKESLAMLVTHGSFESALHQQVPSEHIRHVEKVLESIKLQLVRNPLRKGRW